MRQTAARSDIEEGVNSDCGEDDEKETPEMNLTVAIGVLIAATGLTCKCHKKPSVQNVDKTSSDVTAEALTDSLEGIGQVGRRI